MAKFHTPGKNTPLILPSLVNRYYRWAMQAGLKNCGWRRRQKLILEVVCVYRQNGLEALAAGLGELAHLFDKRGNVVAFFG